jgi:hypothetical protein
MLAVLQENLPSENRPRLQLLQADLTSFHLETQFPLAILPCNTYSTLTQAQRQAALANLRLHSQPGGVFAFSAPNPHQLATLPESGEPEVEDTFPHPFSGNPVQAVSNWERGEDYCSFIWHYDHLLPDGTVERLTLINRHTLATPADYQAELRAAGYNLLGMYGDFDRSPFHANAAYLILTANVLP